MNTDALEGGMARNANDGGSRRAIALWFAWLAGPLAWAIHLGVSYPLVYWVCASGNHGVLHLLTLGTLLLATGGVVVAWRLWRQVEVRWPDESGSRTARTRFLAAGGVVLSLVFAVAILVEGMPAFILDACR